MNLRFRIVTAHLSGSRWKPRSCHCSRSLTSSSPENRSMAGEGCSIWFWRRSHPRCCCSSFHCGYTPLRAGGLIKQQHGTDEPTNTSVVLQTEDRNEQRLWVLWGVFVPVPSMVERHEFLLRSDILLCL